MGFIYFGTPCTKFRYVTKNNNLMLFFPCLFIVSLRWLTVDFEQCHHRDAASSVSAFLTLAVTDLLPLQNSSFQHLQLDFHFFCGPAHYCSLCSKIWWFSFSTVSRSDTEHQQNILLYKTSKIYQSLFAKSSATPVRSLPTFGCILADWKLISKLSSLFSEHFSSLPISLSAYPQCMLIPMLSKITKLFI